MKLLSFKDSVDLISELCLNPLSPDWNNALAGVSSFIAHDFISTELTDGLLIIDDVGVVIEVEDVHQLIINIVTFCKEPSVTDTQIATKMLKNTKHFKCELKDLIRSFVLLPEQTIH